jgi:hypothetical protein
MGIYGRHASSSSGFLSGTLSPLRGAGRRGARPSSLLRQSHHRREVKIAHQLSCIDPLGARRFMSCSLLPRSRQENRRAVPAPAYCSSGSS